MTASATPSPTIIAKISKSQADSLVGQAALVPGSLAWIGDVIQPTESKATLTLPPKVCGWDRVPSDAISGRTTTWLFEGIEVVQTVAAFESAEADAVLAESRRDMGRCEPIVAGTFTEDQHAVQTLPTYPGVADGYGWSFRQDDGGKVTYVWEIQVVSPDRHLVADLLVAEFEGDAFNQSDAKSAALKAASLQATRVAAVSLSQ